MTWKLPWLCRWVHVGARLQCHGYIEELNDGKRGEGGSDGRRGEAVAT